MIAGTVGLLDTPADAPLETAYTNGSELPALEVEDTQESLNGQPVQSGVAARYVTTWTQVPTVATDRNNDPVGIVTEREETANPHETEWVADVTNTGLVAAESLANKSSDFPFPFDLMMAQTDRGIDRIWVDIESLHAEWASDGGLNDVWMVGADAGDGAKIKYHDQASVDEPATIGIGFQRSWGGSFVRGVCYASGYVAIFSTESPTAYVRFVEDQLLPHAERVEDDGLVQMSLDETGAETCDDCGREPERGLEEVGGDDLCVVCASKRDEDGEVTA